MKSHIFKQGVESTDVPKPSFDIHEPDSSGFIGDTTPETMTKITSKPLNKMSYGPERHKSRVIDVPVNSNSLVFQMLIYYNFFYAFLHAFFFVMMGIYKLWVFRVREYREVLTFFFTCAYLPVELFVLYFGYVGNIKEAVSLTYTVVP